MLSRSPIIESPPLAEHTDLKLPRLTADFNNLEDLGQIDQALEGQLNAVVLDRATLKLTVPSWGLSWCCQPAFSTF